MEVVMDGEILTMVLKSFQVSILGKACQGPLYLLGALVG